VVCKAKCLEISLIQIGRSTPTLTEARTLIEDLQGQLRALASQNILFIAPELARHNATADRSRSLTLASLNQHTNPLMAASASMLSLPSMLSDGATPSVMTIPAAISQPLILGRTFFNVHNLCRNAQRYRDNTHAFRELTVRVVAPRPHPTWACAHCGAELTRVNLPLAPPPSPPADRLWINAAGMLQAHCHAGGGGLSGGWACIWPVRDAAACRSPFAGERALLEHMRRWHVELRGAGDARAAAVDWPADGMRRVAGECGFGVEVGGRGMREGSANFVVPAAVRA
jgi:hypothetical protein